MKKAAVTIQVLSSTVFFCALGCSSAAPTAPVTRRQTTVQPASSDATQTQTGSQDTSTRTETAETPKAEEKPADTPAPPPATPAAMTLTSTAFANMGVIPVIYVQNGMNQSPPLQWQNAPAGTGSFAIQMVDLDFLNPSPAPFIHWVITNIPASSTQLPAAVPGGNNLAAPAEAMGASQFKNYRGPNPPNLHRYEWTIYAIKQGETLNIIENSVTNKAELEAKSLGKATLIGTYQP